LLSALGRHADALVAHGEAIARSEGPPPEEPILAHSFASPWYNRAADLAILGRRDDALADLRRAITLAPSWAEDVISDERFLRLADDNELQRMIAEGRAAQQARVETAPGEEEHEKSVRR
jgi:hypothetical protein